MGSPRTVVRPGLGAQFDAVLAAAQVGGGWAVATLYRSLQPQVLRYLTARAGQDGEDIAADAWLDVARGLAGFHGDELAFRSWVFTIAHRRLVDHQRSRSRQRDVVVSNEELADFRADDDPADRVIERLAGDRAIRRIGELLSSDQAEVILLRVIGGLSTNEVAQITGRRPGTLRVLQHRALRQLAKKLGESRPGV